MWQQGTGRTGKIAPTQIQIDPLDGYEVIRSSTRTKKKFNKRAQNIKYEGEKQNTLESIPAFIPLSRSQDRR